MGNLEDNGKTWDNYIYVRLHAVHKEGVVPILELQGENNKISNFTEL